MDIPSLSQHPIKNTVLPNGLEYYYIEKGEGPTIFFLHGFPDLANTWDETIATLSANYRCIAPFLRGYFPTAIPKDGDYKVKTIAADITALAEQLGIDQYKVVGQDWGASVTYAVANLVPEKVTEIVTVAIPHPAFIKPSLMTLYKARHFLRFRNPKKSTAFTRKNNFAYIDTLFKRWSPNWKNWQEASNLIKETYAMPGRLEASLGYYWSFHETLQDKTLARFYGKRPEMPLLTIVGKTDGALILNAFYEMEKKFPDNFQLIVHEEAGHFLHREAPDFFIKALQRRFNKH